MPVYHEFIPDLQLCSCSGHQHCGVMWFGGAPISQFPHPHLSLFAVLSIQQPRPRGAMMKRVVRVLSLLLLVFAPHAEGTRKSFLNHSCSILRIKPLRLSLPSHFDRRMSEDAERETLWFAGSLEIKSFVKHGWLYYEWRGDRATKLQIHLIHVCRSCALSCRQSSASCLQSCATRQLREVSFRSWGSYYSLVSYVDFGNEVLFLWL